MPQPSTYQTKGGMVYRRRLLPAEPSPGDLRAVVEDYQTMLVSVMTAIAERYERRPDYPYIDTKLSLLTGEDFREDDQRRGPGSIYGWIQGRGLEALVEHCLWWRAHPEIEEGAALIPRLERIMREVLARLRSLRRQNGGHLFFLMTPEGEPFVLNEAQQRVPLTAWSSEVYCFADLFCAKGIFAAGVYLEDAEAQKEGEEYARLVQEAILDRRFAANERNCPPNEGPQPNPHRRGHGPYMIQLGTAALMCRFGTSPDPYWINAGLALLRHIMEHHVNINDRMPGLLPGDYWEEIDAAGRPYVDQGALLSNPGHSIEVTGLGLKFIQAAKSSAALRAAPGAALGPTERRTLDEMEKVLPLIFLRNFTNGFLPEVGGICEFYDLYSRTPRSPHMPWWSLPESIRAAAEAWEVLAKNGAGADAAAPYLKALSAAHNAFARHYVRTDLMLMAYQTRGTDGLPVDHIPATADADPGYHTGASIIDFLRIVERSCPR